MAQMTGYKYLKIRLSILAQYFEPQNECLPVGTSLSIALESPDRQNRA